MTGTGPHPGEPHDLSYSSRLNALRAGVLGANDGIVSIAAMLLGVIATGASATTVFAAGLASTIAGAVSMALGEYVSVSAQRDSEKTMIAKETTELREMPEAERRELSGIFQGYGVTKETADRAAEEIAAGDPLPAHLQLELGLDSEDLTNPWTAAGASAVSFILGALLPLLSVLIAPDNAAAVVLTVVTLLTLASTGCVSAKLAGNPVLRSAARLVVGGALGLALTYGVGSLFDVPA
ncbi:MAG: VIT1/CCC1 transporter family protein [Corynebacterium sp.]|uniref:VIT1/CCC1 transporter family protein n=1 Tax=Corynebacterium sp. TaxID=1720 RepID=UPI003F99703D